MSEWYIDEISSLNKEIEKITEQRDDLLEAAEKMDKYIAAFRRQALGQDVRAREFDGLIDAVHQNKQAIKKAKGGE